MARKFLTAIDLAKNELQNAAVQNLASAPSAPVKGQMYFNSTGGDNTLYWWDGSSWVPAKATGGAFPGYGTVPAETTFALARADGSATTVARSDHTHGSPTHDAAAHSGIKISDLSSPTTAVSFGGQRITTLGTPTAGTDATTKDYVDNLSSGLSWKESVRVATLSNGTLATAFANGQTLDSVALVTGNRILIKNQAAPAENGIYTVNASGAPTRATDADAVGELEQATVFVQDGTQGDTAWVCTTNGVITPGTTALTWAQFGAGTAYTAGNGLNLIGSTFNVVPGDGSLSAAVGNLQVVYAGTGTTYGTAVTAARSDHTHNNYAQKVSQSIGNGALTSITVTHGLNTRNLVAEVFRTASPYDTIVCDIERTDASNVLFRFAVAPTTNEYTVVMIG